MERTRSTAPPDSLSSVGIDPWSEVFVYVLSSKILSQFYILLGDHPLNRFVQSLWPLNPSEEWFDVSPSLCPRPSMDGLSG